MTAFRIHQWTEGGESFLIVIDPSSAYMTNHVQHQEPTVHPLTLVPLESKLRDSVMEDFSRTQELAVATISDHFLTNEVREGLREALLTLGEPLSDFNLLVVDEHDTYVTRL